MRLHAVFAVTGLLMFAGGAHAASVEIKDAVARVVVIPEDRADIKVEFLTTNPNLPMTVRALGDRVIVDGGLRHRIRDCTSQGARIHVQVAGVGSIAIEDIPQVVIRTPKDVNIETGGAVFGAIGKSDNLNLANAGCGDWTVANVAGKGRVSQAGSGDTATGSMGEAIFKIAGSGDIHAGAIEGPMTVDVAGSGDVSAASLNGSLDVKIAGSGDLRIAGGRAKDVDVSIAGSGDVSLDCVADSLRARVAGSGDVRVRQVTGSVSKSIMGSGGVTIG